MEDIIPLKSLTSFLLHREQILERVRVTNTSPNKLGQ